MRNSIRGFAVGEAAKPASCALARRRTGRGGRLNVAVQPKRPVASPTSTGAFAPGDAAALRAPKADVTPTSIPPAAPAPFASASAQAQKSAYVAPASLPTQQGPQGVRFDYNDGARVAVPEGDAAWRIRLSDSETGNVLYETTIKAGRVASAKRYFVPIRVEVWQGDDKIFTHEYAAKDREVLIQFPVGTLGDTIGWFPYAVKFKYRHGCRLTCAMSKKLIPLFRDAYPDIAFVAQEEVNPERYYATYGVGLFFDDKANILQPVDFRHVGLHRTAGFILGVDPAEVRPQLAIPDADVRPIEEPYVCIGVQATTQAKKWNNPEGWLALVRFLKDVGYRVVCVDEKPTHGQGLAWTQIPNGAEDRTGLCLRECARWLRHAEFYVGLSSGLSWLAWAAETRVVLISGFSLPSTEFETPWRVINWHTCNGCWNDPALRFDHKDFLWCPRHKETPRQFECTRLITVEQVKRVIERMLGLGARAPNHESQCEKEPS
jgi:autotransporter strand-loop-strand O-heptosyltransferase